MSLKHENKKNDTELSSYLWQLREKKKDLQSGGKSLEKQEHTPISPNGAIYALQRNFFIIS